jgi:hypothetical protein
MDQIVNLIVQMLGGAAGGNAAGAAMKSSSLSVILRTILGIVGGVGGGQLATLLGVLQQFFGEAASTGELAAGNAGISAICGAVLTAIVGYFKKSMATKA